MTVEVIHAAFAKGKADLRAAASELSTTRTQIDRRINEFLGRGWTGTAADSYVEPWGDWLRGATDLEEGLVAMAELLDASHRDFVAQDDASQQALDRISARIIERLG